MKDRVWIAGIVYNDEIHGEETWALVGVFESESLAVAACTTTKHFVGPAIMNERLPDEITEWEDGYYPMQEVMDYDDVPGGASVASGNK